MTYATGREYYDADSHIMELPNFLTEFADPGIREKLPAISYAASAVSEEEALELMRQNGHSQAYKKELLALGDDMIRGPKEIQALGAFDGADRGAALDILGFRKQLVFSTLSAALPMSTRVKTDGELQYGAARAHNRAMQAFCSHDDRLLPVLIIPLD
ncbi:MAG: hydrolase, partial [Pseudomonadota bacterium]|nr:hydrolase [Pseudomonadota bacterium]